MGDSNIFSPFTQAFAPDIFTVSVNKSDNCCQGVNLALANFHRQLGSVYGNTINQILVAGGETIFFIPPRPILEYLLTVSNDIKQKVYNAYKKILSTCPRNDECCGATAQAIANAALSAFAQIGLSIQVFSQGENLTPELIIQQVSPTVQRILDELDDDILRILSLFNKC